MKSETDLISVLLPVKNAALFLNDTLQSIIDQSFKNWELICVNDHSDDQSLPILNKFSSLHNNIIVLNNKGKGIINALQTAYENSAGNYISRMDADDLMHPDKLKLMIDCLQASQKGHVVTAKVKYFSEEEKGINGGYRSYEIWLNQLTENENNFSEIYKECVIPSPCWMVHRHDLENCNAFDSDLYPEDYDLCFRMYQNRLKIIGINKVLHYWRDHSNRTSRTDSNYADNRFLSLKLKYFINCDHNDKKELILWGAGRKGKEIAKKLKEQNVRFRWLSDNKNKIGHFIYDTPVESYQILKEIQNSQIIVAIANKKEQQDIKSYLKTVNIDPYQIFFFC